jgi:hypothetical protein
MSDQREILEPADPMETPEPVLSWDEWLDDNDHAWPDEDQAPDQFVRIP